MRALSALAALALMLGPTGCTITPDVPRGAAPSSTPPSSAPAPSPLAAAEEAERPRTHRTTTEHFKGSGDKVIPIEPTGEIGLITVGARGTGSFIVRSVDASGDDVEFLAQGEDDHHGTRFYNLEAEEEITALSVTAQGPWRITLHPPSSAPVWKGPRITGSGDAVLQLHQKAEGSEKITSAFTGESNFIVEGAGENDSSLLANEIGTCEVQETLPEGTFLIVIKGDGPWTLSRSGPDPRLTAAGPHVRGGLPVL
ncbi:hypothetical protein [Planomonospora venezuelensis]|uniref:Lipoprotein n=1 Tax=Planomonospora venezuelensis TaxID=1999 RepID=A0A841DEK1_PLAVE|nr:hypothetical protein [Planomonospora venezuelensis]MBB5967193.1 hypothetical protein [Planomonospora venezuelensis]GIN02962.1 hypothetical protein Pve01_46200 [Planomonospora venezuelensis]